MWKKCNFYTKLGYKIQIYQDFLQTAKGSKEWKKVIYSCDKEGDVVKCSLDSQEGGLLSRAWKV